MKSSIKRMLMLAILVVIGVACWMAWVRMQPSGPGDGFISGNGRIEATEIDIAAKLGGRVVDVFVDEGEFVEKGQSLAQMQIDVLNAQLDEGHAHLQQAINAVATAEAGVAVRESDLAAAQAVVVQRENELDNAERRAARSEALVANNAVSKQEFDDDMAAVRSNEATVTAAKAQVEAAKAGIVAAKAQVTGARSAVDAAKATIARIEADIADSQLRAPRGGRIQYRIAESGEVLGAGGKVLNMVDLSDVYMTFFLPETVVGRVALDSEARIMLDALPSYVIPARISFVSSVAQFTPKTVETAVERQKLMFRVKARINPELLKEHVKQVKTGLPGVAWLKLDPQAEWPQKLAVRVPE